MPPTYVRVTIFYNWIEYVTIAVNRNLNNCEKARKKGLTGWSPEILFFRAFSQLFKLRFTAMVTYSIHLYSRSSHHFIFYNCPLLQKSLKQLLLDSFFSNSILIEWTMKSICNVHYLYIFQVSLSSVSQDKVSRLIGKVKECYKGALNL